MKTSQDVGAGSGKSMKRDRIPKVAEQRAEYKLSDFPAPMVQGKYAKRLRKSSNIVVLKPVVAEAFPSAEIDSISAKDATEGEKMKKSKFPSGWGEKRVRQVLNHYEQKDLVVHSERREENNKQKETGMGTFHVGAMIENHTDRKKSVRIAKLLVDTGSEHTWLPETTLDKIGVKREKKDISFMMANGTIVTRSIGFAIVHVDKYFTIDEVVFAEKGDLVLLGARTLEGLNLTVNPTRKKLVAAGPIPAA